MNYFFKKILKLILPTSFFFILKFYYRLLNGRLDAEMFYVLKKLKHKRVFIDIGANQGIYSYYYSKYFKNIHAFEPIFETIKDLKYLRIKNITFHHVGLSNKNTEMFLHLPIINNMVENAESTLELINAPHLKKKIKVRSIDSYNFHNIDLIKIDVEGHEESIILGGKKTILNQKPTLIIEIEQRHIKKPINSIFDLISKMEYEGYFLENNQLKEISNFKYDLHQKPYLDNVHNKKYINNFIFFPK